MARKFARVPLLVLLILGLVPTARAADSGKTVPGTAVGVGSQNPLRSGDASPVVLTSGTESTGPANTAAASMGTVSTGTVSTGAAGTDVATVGAGGNSSQGVSEACGDASRCDPPWTATAGGLLLYRTSTRGPQLFSDPGDGSLLHPRTWDSPTRPGPG